MTDQSGGLSPMFLSKVSGGFPQTADDQVESPLDLNEYLVRHPSATYFVRVTGESMTGAGIYPDDRLIVDRSLTPYDGCVVVAAVEGEFTVKRLRMKFGERKLVSDNGSMREISFTSGGFEIWGVVTHSIRHHI